MHPEWIDSFQVVYLPALRAGDGWGHFDTLDIVSLKCSSLSCMGRTPPVALGAHCPLPVRSGSSVLLRECPPDLTNIDNDVDRVRRIHCKEPPCQP